MTVSGKSTGVSRMVPAAYGKGFAVLSIVLLAGLVALLSDGGDEGASAVGTDGEGLPLESVPAEKTVWRSGEPAPAGAGRHAERKEAEAAAQEREHSPWWEDSDRRSAVQAVLPRFIASEAEERRQAYEDRRIGEKQLQSIAEWDEERLGFLRLHPSFLGLPEWESSHVANLLIQVEQDHQNPRPLDPARLEDPLEQRHLLERSPVRLLGTLGLATGLSESGGLRLQIREAWTQATQRAIPLLVRKDLLLNAYQKAQAHVLGEGTDPAPRDVQLELAPELAEVEERIRQINLEYLEDLRRIVAAEQARLAVAGESG